jgi:hypothetical protein
MTALDLHQKVSEVPRSVAAPDETFQAVSVLVQQPMLHQELLESLHHNVKSGGLVNVALRHMTMINRPTEKHV